MKEAGLAILRSCRGIDLHERLNREDAKTRRRDMEFDPLSWKVIGAAIAVHRELGPGLLESAYERCMAVEMAERGIAYERQLHLPLIYHGVSVEPGYRLDFLVEKELVLEVKAVSALMDVFMAQVLTYLKLTKCHVGLLLNFNVPALREGGIERIVDEWPEYPSRPSRLRGEKRFSPPRWPRA